MEQVAVIGVIIFILAGGLISTLALVKSNGRFADDEMEEEKPAQEIKVQSTVKPKQTITFNIREEGRRQMNLHPKYNKNVYRGADGRYKSFKKLKENLYNDLKNG